MYERDYDLQFAALSESGNPGLMLEQRVQWFARFSVLVRLFYSALMISILTLPLVSYDGSWLFLSLPFIVAAFLLSWLLPASAPTVNAYLGYPAYHHDYHRSNCPCEILH